MRMVRKQVYITAEQEQRLKRLARETGAAEADLIRRALDALQGAEYAAAAAAREVATASYEAMRNESMRAVLTGGQVDDAAWQEELAFIQARARSGAGSTVTWNREDSYDNRRLRLPD